MIRSICSAVSVAIVGWSGISTAAAQTQATSGLRAPTIVITPSSGPPGTLVSISVCGMKLGCGIGADGRCFNKLTADQFLNGRDNVTVGLPRNIMYERFFQVSVDGETRLIYPGDGQCPMNMPDRNLEIPTAGFGFGRFPPAVRLRMEGPPGPREITIERVIQNDTTGDRPSSGDLSPYRAKTLTATFHVVDPLRPADVSTKPATRQPAVPPPTDTGVKRPKADIVQPPTPNPR